MTSTPNGNKLTVQGLGNLVPAAMESEQAGFQSSISNDRNATAVENLAAEADKSTSSLNSVAYLAGIKEATSIKNGNDTLNEGSIILSENDLSTDMERRLFKNLVTEKNERKILDENIKKLEKKSGTWRAE